MKLGKNSAVFVIGMHRSGTSAVSGALRFLGLSHGHKVMAPAEDNPKGFWENRIVVNLNDRMLNSVGAHWDVIPSFVGTKVNELVDPADYMLSGFLDRANQVWRSQFDHSVAGVALKDPRTCFTLPIWQEIAARNGRQVSHLFAVRPVEDVARSLAARNNLAKKDSEMLWAHYNLAALRHLPEGTPIIWHNDFLSRPSTALRNADLIIDEVQSAAIEHFVEKPVPGISRQVTAGSRSIELIEIVTLVYKAIGNGDALGPFDQRKELVATGFEMLRALDQNMGKVFQVGTGNSYKRAASAREYLVTEYYDSFSSLEEWKESKPDQQTNSQVREAVLNFVREHGLIEPITNIHRSAKSVSVNENNIRESISSNELNSRKRALLFQIWRELQSRGLWGRRDLRILGAEALSRLALIMRGLFPFYIGTEYLPDEESLRQFFPIPHGDLQELPFEDQSFDLFVSGDVFEHIPDLDKCLSEIIRVLKPGGLLISSFPFSPNRQDRLVKARINSQTGEVEYLAPPEYHGNPVEPEGGALVYSLPGWEIVETVKRMGAQDAYFSLIASTRFGIAADHTTGPLVFSAVKGGEPAGERPRRLQAFQNLPERICVLGALPRSGTTLLTSMLSVHSKVSAIYEPWNAKLMSDNDPVTLETLIQKSNSGDLFGRTLLVKETGKSDVFVQNLAELLDSAPFFTKKSSITMLRRPDQTFLSEVARRNEWWGGSVELGLEAFDAWCQKSVLALRQIIELGMRSHGNVCSLEALSSQPKLVLTALMDGLDLPFEPQQLQYQDHLDRSKVRGDLNVSKNPAKIDPKLASSRTGQSALVKQYLEHSQYRTWFNAFDAFCQFVEERSGVVEFSSLTDTEMSYIIHPLVGSPVSG